MKLTLTGRPGPLTVHPAGYVTTTLHTTKVPPLPKGLPAPPTTPTTYTVYFTPKQWSQVAPALADAEDVVIVEGFPAYDPALEGIAVYALKVTTKQLQQARRAEQQPRS
jgi:hypothetical protein